jgi:hypothetical protein
VLINVGYFALQVGKVLAIVEISVESVQDGNANESGAKESHIASRSRRREQPTLPRKRGASIAAIFASVN